MKSKLAGLLIALCFLTPRTALAVTFSAGSIIIPMDTTYQDMGMLKAYGLVYELLRNDIEVNWSIRRGKGPGGVDFTADATDYPSTDVVVQHGYRGGPWVIDSDFVTEALPLIDAWQVANQTTVHIAAQAFSAPISHQLVVAPTIAMLADGNEKIARGYMQAAGIPDSTLDPDWPDSSPDMLSIAELMGATDTNHADGQLFDEDGNPAYCQLMSMHWKIDDARANAEVVAEVREFLNHPTHFFAECQAVNAFENDLVNGLFLTTNGFDIGDRPTAVDMYNADLAFGQLDGAFETVGGSEPSYSVPAGQAYKSNDIVMITEQGSDEGVNDIWMTGYVDGRCNIRDDDDDIEQNGIGTCSQIGKVSYLGGHKYAVALPISSNPDTQGTRLFLNSLFEAPCATRDGQPRMEVRLSGPAATSQAELTLTLSLTNEGSGFAQDASLSYILPADVSFVSASDGGLLVGSTVTWPLGSVGGGASQTVTLSLSLEGYAQYTSRAQLDFEVGVNTFTEVSEELTTTYGSDADNDGVLDASDSCPELANPEQSLNTDPANCGACGNICAVSNGSASCIAGECAVASCESAYSDCDGDDLTGCEYESANFASDAAHCGQCGVVCSSGVCEEGECALGACDAGFEDCNALVEDGCEVSFAALQTSQLHCGGCGIECGSEQQCQSGVCVAANCSETFRDCGGSAGSCAVDIDSDVDSCGACGASCSMPNAEETCVAGACQIAVCDAGFVDCNGLAFDGCEQVSALLNSDVNNCGACGRVCSSNGGVSLCQGGVCVITSCGADSVDCNGDAADGCELLTADLLTNAEHCGACGASCAGPGATSACVDGECDAAICMVGFVDTDGNRQNGCELACSSTEVSEQECNGIDDDCDGQIDEDYVGVACGTGVCASGAICIEGVETCTPGFAGIEGPGAEPSCQDGADNDCDGISDQQDSDCIGPSSGVDAERGAGAAGEISSSGASALDVGELGGAEQGAVHSTAAGGTAAGIEFGADADGAGGAPSGSLQDESGALSDALLKQGSAGFGALEGEGSGVSADAGTDIASNLSATDDGCGCRIAVRERSDYQLWALGLLVAIGWLRRREA